MADENGLFPVGSLNAWERKVVDAELAQSGCVAWYRNPPRQAVDSVGVAYRDEVGNWRSMHPDFVFFRETDGGVRPSIVDPHGHHLDDSIVKLHGLARFAAEYGDEFDRIEALSEVGTSMRVLDLQDGDVRGNVLASTGSPEDLYKADFASDYDA